MAGHSYSVPLDQNFWPRLASYFHGKYGVDLSHLTIWLPTPGIQERFAQALHGIANQSVLLPKFASFIPNMATIQRDLPDLAPPLTATNYDLDLLHKVQTKLLAEIPNFGARLAAAKRLGQLQQTLFENAVTAQKIAELVGAEWLDELLAELGELSVNHSQQYLQKWLHYQLTNEINGAHYALLGWAPLTALTKNFYQSFTAHGGSVLIPVDDQAIIYRVETEVLPAGQLVISQKTDELTGYVVASSPEQELNALALLVREQIAAGKSVGVITPDRDRHAALRTLLTRWQIRCLPTERISLAATPLGRLINALIAAAREPTNGLILANLCHAIGSVRPTLNENYQQLSDAVFRSLAPAEWSSWLDTNRLDYRLTADDRQMLTETFKQLGDVLAHVKVEQSCSLSHWGEQLQQALNLFHKLDPQEPATMAWRELVQSWQTIHHHYKISDLQAIVHDQLALTSVLYEQPANVQVYLLSPDQVELQHYDVMIVTGCGQKDWSIRGRNSLLGKKLQQRLGLLSPVEQDQITMQRAIAYWQECSQVWLTACQQETDGAPQALTGWAQTALGDRVAELAQAGKKYLDYATWAMPATGGPAATPAPQPQARPGRLSASQVTSLLNCPYQAYTSTILQLQEWKEFNASFGPAERGDVLHSVFAAFVAQQPGFPPPYNDSYSVEKSPTMLAKLEELLDHTLSLVNLPELNTVWTPRWRQVFPEIITEWIKRPPTSAEQKVNVQLGAVEFVARIDAVLADENMQQSIIDYKTGSAAISKTHLLNGKAPQLAVNTLAYAAQQQLTHSQLSPPELWFIPPSGPPTLKALTLPNQVSGEAYADYAQDSLHKIAQQLHEPAQTFPVVAGKLGQDGYDGPCRYCRFSEICRVKEWGQSVDD